MGLLKKIGHGLKAASKFAAPALALTGVGIPAALAIGAGTRLAGGLASGDKLNRVLKDTAYGGARDAIAGGAGKTLLSKVPGAGRVSSLASGLKAKVESVPGVTALERVGGGIRDKVSTVRKAAGLDPITLQHTGAGGGIGGLIDKYGDAALAGAGALAAADAERKRDRLLGKSVQGAEQAYAERAPLREAGRAMLLHPERPDLSAAYATDPANPFRRRKTISLPRA